jgi:diadenylate cyclase
MTHQIPSFVQELKATITFSDLLDIGVISLFFYITLSWLRRKTSRAILFVVAPVGGLFVAARVFHMYLTSLLFQTGLTVISVAIVVVFQEDFRRAFESVASWKFSPSKRGFNSQNKVIEILTECLGKFAQCKLGALIVIKGRESLDPYVRGGVPVRGEISAPLLHSIFDHHSPGHDGGVIIESDRIEKLGVHLPLARNLEAVGRSGTRHAAALGLSQRSDALIICISEETGEMSYAFEGKIKLLSSKKELRERIERFYSELFPHRQESENRSWGMRHLGAKFSSVALGVLFWIIFAFPAPSVQRTFDIPIEYSHLPKDWGANDPNPSKARVTLFGSERSLSQLASSQVVLALDLSNIKEGEQQIPLSEDALDLPSSISVKNIRPREVHVNAYPMELLDLPVKLHWEESTEKAEPQIAVTLKPSVVRVKVRKNARHPASAIETEPISAQEFTATKSHRVKLILPQDTQFAEASPPEVTLTVGGN